MNLEDSVVQTMIKLGFMAILYIFGAPAFMLADFNFTKNEQ